MKDTQGLARGLRRRRVGVLDVDMFLGQPFQNPGERSGAVLELDGQHLGDAILGPQRGQDALGRVEIARDEPEHAGPVGLHDREGQDIDLLLGECGTDLGETAGLVLEKAVTSCTNSMERSSVRCDER